MSDVIQLLPDSVANQIAAGEVIQRPASVIKELVENAVDAGAHCIKVLVTDAGRTSIQVIDDGHGMTDTDARLAFERHATSKIRNADDLFALRTMGFRGEALASIAAVAKVELKTRLEGNEIGTSISIAGSKVTNQEPVSCPVGCNFTIENLFYNVPARRKFLKTNATELNNIMTAFERIVLVYPDINFIIYSNGTELLNLRAGSLHQRISDVFGKRFNQDILPLKVDTAICNISGFVGKPDAARRKGAHEYFFVNGRYMKHPYFHKAVVSAFDRLIPMGMHVPYFIYFDINPADIDVNIHPTKTEIKFENEQAIWQILTAAVKDAIGKFCEVPSIDFDTEGKPDIPIFDPAQDVTIPTTSFNPSYNPFKSTSHQSSAPAGWQRLYDEPSARFEDTIVASRHEQLPMFDMPDTIDENTAAGKLLIEDKSPAHYQYKGKYIMTAVKSGLMVIDQHRADMRIRYEKYLSSIRSRTSAGTQRVLFPEIVKFSPSEGIMLRKIMPELTDMGFDLADMGHDCYAVNGVPSDIDGLNFVTLLTSIVNDATEKSNDSTDEINKSLALSMARSTAIPQGQILDNNEMENIVNGLFSCSNVNYTPDGKTIIGILRQTEIEKLLN
ncbi:MAG: DNA mismatch repair endonuclease MutL [Prevotella sp.]|nr:DNA mismatch repair endonuclease MutL [Prevotella sp.]